MTIERVDVGSRMSKIVIHNGTVYLCGQTAKGAPDAPAAGQTQDILKRIEALLAEAGTDKSKLLSVTIYLADIAHFAAVNDVWDAWVAPGSAPARACVEARLARPELLVEMSVIAAV